MVSAVLGLIRERLLIANFGIGPTLDAYNIAFTVPDFMYTLLVSGALSVSFIPVLNQRLGKGNKESAWQMSSSLINFMAIITFCASILIFIFADVLTAVIARGSDPYVKETAADLMRIIAINPFLFSISAVVASMQQAVGRFFFNAVAPVIYNIGIIIGITVFAPAIGTPADPSIVGVALGVSLGAVAQFLFQFLGMSGIGYVYEAAIHWRNRGFRKVLRLLPARSLDQSIDYLNSIVEKFIASFLFAGAITSYQAAFTLRTVPITLIGAAIATASFPSITERAASKRTDLFRRDVTENIMIILWLSIPAATIAFFMRGYLVRLLVGEGNIIIAQILAWFSISIVFRALFHSITRAFYAQQDTKTPLYVSLAAIGLNIALAITLTKIFGIVGLAMAQSAVAVFEVTILMVLLTRKLGVFLDKASVINMARMTGAALAAAVVNYAFIRYIFPLKALDVGFISLAPKFGLIVSVTLIVYFAVSYIFKIPFAKPLIRSVARFIFKPVKTVS